MYDYKWRRINVNFIYFAICNERTKKPPKRRLLLIILLNQNLTGPKDYFLVRTKFRFSNSFKHFLNTFVLSSGSKPSM